MVPPSTAAGRGRTSRTPLRLRILIAVLAVLAILVGLNAFVLDRETGKAELNVPGAELIDTTSGPLQVLDTGPAGPPGSLPLLLVHGSGGAINWWDEILPLLRARRRVIVVDLLGYGGSAKPDSGYSIESQAGLVAQVLNRLEVGRVVAVGHSLGGSVVTALARNSPALVAGVVLVDSSPDRSGGNLGLTARAAMAPVIGPLLWRLAPDSVRRRGLSQAFAPGTEVASRYVEDLKRMTYPAYRQSGREVDRFVREASLPDRLQTSGLPLLVIFGEEDRIYPAREALSAYAGIPGVATVLIPRVGHSPQIEAPRRTAGEILAFAARTDREDRRRAARHRRLRRARAARASRARKRASAARHRAGHDHRKKPKKNAATHRHGSRKKPDRQGGKRKGQDGTAQP